MSIKICHSSGSHGDEYEDVFWVLYCVVWWKVTDISEMPAASIIRTTALTDTVSAFEISATFTKTT
jgi:hypothetical protein